MFHFFCVDWFSGWPQHGQYNKQPNDDGLSGQDCVELRRHFSTPPGGPPTPTNPLSLSYMWNDRDCEAKNFYLCARSVSDGKFLLMLFFWYTHER